MQDKIIIISIIAGIAVFVLLTGGLLFASIVRRGYNARKYRELDSLRTKYRVRLLGMLESASPEDQTGEFAALPGSVPWQAIEDVR